MNDLVGATEHEFKAELMHLREPRRIYLAHGCIHFVRRPKTDTSAPKTEKQKLDVVQ